MDMVKIIVTEPGKAPEVREYNLVDGFFIEFDKFLGTHDTLTHELVFGLSTVLLEAIFGGKYYDEPFNFCYQNLLEVYGTAIFYNETLEGIVSLTEKQIKAIFDYFKR